MQLGLFQNIIKEVKKIDIGEFMKEISERMKQMEEELVIDRFEGNIAICENRKTGEIKEVARENIEQGMQEGSVIKQENGKYVQVKGKQEEIESRIKDKMNQIWKNETCK